MTREYSSAVREEGARRTKQLISEAARSLFLADGYGPTSMTAIARAAGVSAQTVYNVFGTKAALLKHVYDITLVGDDEPVPFAERRQARDVRELTDARELLSAYAHVGLELLRRLGPLIGVIRAGAQAGDQDLLGHLRTTAHERLTGVTMVVDRLVELDALSPQVSPAEARDAIWMLISVEVWELLTIDRGWSGERYAAWVGKALADAVLRGDGSPPAP